MNLNAETLLRDFPRLVKYLDAVIVFLWRLGLGRLVNLWPEMTGRTLILKHTDRKNNHPIHTPLNYYEHDGTIYCWSPPGAQSGWHTNIIANPQVEIWLPDGWYAGICDDINTPEEKREILRAGLLSSRITAWMTGADHEKLDDLMRDYPLVRITRQSPRTGTDGPGGLAWLWPLIAVFLLGVRPRRRR